MEAVFNRKICVAVLIHDIHRAKRPTINLECFTMLLSRDAITVVKRIGLHNAAFWNSRLERLNHFSGNNIGSMSFAGVKLNCHLSVDFTVDKVVKLYEMLSVNFACEINLCC